MEAVTGTIRPQKTAAALMHGIETKGSNSDPGHEGIGGLDIWVEEKGSCGVPEWQPAMRKSNFASMF